MVGLPGFEPGSIAPEATSLDQTSRQPPIVESRVSKGQIAYIIKTLSKLQHLSKANQRAIWYRLLRLGKLCNLLDPAFVDKAIYGLDVKNIYKNKLFNAYQYFCKANSIEYCKPRKLREESFIIHVPTEERIDKVIACSGWTYSTVFSLSKYGLRPDEISKLTLRDLDLEHGHITVPTSKLGSQRTLNLKKQTVDLLKEYLSRKKPKGIDERLFGSVDKIKSHWRKNRYKAYCKFMDIELLKIRLYDLRHWFGTAAYMSTRDIFYVKYALGHRRIENTMVYVHLAKALTSYSDDYTCRMASTVDEAVKLVETGFEYVTEIDNVKLFRKRK